MTKVETRETPDYRIFDFFDSEKGVWFMSLVAR